MTTVGPDGRVRHISNNPRSDSPMPAQIPVPTLEDFLGMHGHPGFGTQAGAYDEPFGPGSVGLMLRHLMERVAPIHGSSGDYLPFVQISLHE